MPIKNLFYPINYLKISKNYAYDSIKLSIYSQQTTFLAICIPNIVNNVRPFHIR